MAKKVASTRTVSKRTRGPEPPSPPNDAEPDAPPATPAATAAGFAVRHGHALGFLSLALLVAVSYLPAMLWGGFVWDDVDHIPGEPAIRDWSGLWRIWFVPSEVQEPHYRPMTYTSFWLEHKLWGFAATGYHVVNVLLHVTNTVLLWRLLRRLAVPGAWVIAAVFAVHPLHVESVAWTIERKDVLSGLFYLTCILTWSRFLEEPRWWRYGLALVLLAAGTLAKNMVVTLPAALVILHWWRDGRVTARDLLRLAPFFVVALGLVGVDLWMVTTATPAAFGYSMIERVLIASRAFWFYVGKLLYPANLAVIYPHWDVRVWDLPGWAGLAAAAALVGLLWYLRHRIGRGPLAGTLFFAVTLSPTLGFVDHTYMLFSFVADRYQYLAGIGLTAVIIGAAAFVTGRLPDMWRYAAWGLTMVVLLVLGTLTWRQAGIYSDEVTFFRHVIAHNPQAAGAHLNLAKALIALNRSEEAVAAARVAVEQRPDSHDALINLGVALSHLEHFDEAERHFRRAVEIAPHESGPVANLGVLLQRRNRPDEAETALRRALVLAPRDLSVLGNLAKLLDMRQQFGEALDLYDRLLEVGSVDVSVYAARGNIFYRLHRYEEAMASARQALALDPDPPTAFSLHILLGQASWALTQSADAAADHYERALLIDPNHPTVLADLASLRIAQERYDKALELFETAVRLRPDVAKFYSGMGFALYRLGRRDEAIRSLERAVALDPTLEEARRYLKLAVTSGR